MKRGYPWTFYVAVIVIAIVAHWVLWPIYARWLYRMATS